jgi:hypothetical protein
LGIPGQGFHAARIGGYALNDTIATIIGALITAYVMRISILVSLFFWFFIGEVLHYYYGVQTAFLTTIGVEACPSRTDG